VSPRETITLGRAISLWEGSLRARVKAEKTIKSYIRSVEYLEDAYGRDADPKTITTEDVEFVMAKWRGKSPTTVRNRLVAIREFFKWGGKRFGWADPTMAIDIPPRDEPAYRRLTVGEVTGILDVQVDERHHLYVSMLAYTAARIDALRTTTWGDVDLVSGKIVFPHHRAKGRRGHEIPIAEPLLEDLARSKDLRGDDAFDEAYLIPARRRAQFIPSPRRCSGISRRARCRSAGCSRPSLQLRPCPRPEPDHRAHVPALHAGAHRRRLRAVRRGRARGPPVDSDDRDVRRRREPREGRGGPRADATS
jgi:integrase